MVMSVMIVIFEIWGDLDCFFLEVFLFSLTATVFFLFWEKKNRRDVILFGSGVVRVTKFQSFF